MSHKTNKTIDVTVLIITYNPDYRKLFSTIWSSILQKNISFEIIVCDDGSKTNYKKEIETLFTDYPDIPFYFVENMDNVGTVKNILSGLQIASGKYTYVISPGDYFFSEESINKLFAYAESINCDICFGKSQYYYSENGHIEMIRQMTPEAPRIFSRILPQRWITLAFCETQGIVGATYFRRTNIFKQYMEEICSYSLLDEDNCTSYYHLFCAKKRICFCNEYAVWYEYGSGISTSKNSNYLNRLSNDCTNVLKRIQSIQNKNRILDYVLDEDKQHRKRNHPVIRIEVYLLIALGKFLKYKKFQESPNQFFNKVTGCVDEKRIGGEI